MSFKNFAIYSTTAVVFAAAGYGYEHQNSEWLMGFAERGFCLAKDVAKTRYWYPCLDAAVQLEMEQRQAQRLAQADPISDLIRETDAPVKSKKGRRP